MPNGVGVRPGHFVSSLRKKREVLLHLSREKKIANQERIYNPHVGSFSRALVVKQPKFTRGDRADFLMESLPAKRKN
jgi:hypothetical protein